MGDLRKKSAPGGTAPPLPRCAVRIVTFCPPALAIHDMGPDALTSPPPVAPPGPNFFLHKPFHRQPFQRSDRPRNQGFAARILSPSSTPPRQRDRLHPRRRIMVRKLICLLA